MPKIPTDPEARAEFERQLREQELRLAVQMHAVLGSRAEQVERIERLAGLRP